MMTRTTIAPATLIKAGVLCLLLVAITAPMSGCSVWKDRPRLRKQKISMNEPVHNVPPIKVELLNDAHLLIMQAPHSGWGFRIDRDERIAGGTRIFVSVRRPDPTFLYPQAIVEKKLLSDVSSDIHIEIFARVLDNDEKIRAQGYGQIAPVDRFEH